MKRLENKIAFVTGGGRGMGAAISKRLAEEGAIVVNPSDTDLADFLRSRMALSAYGTGEDIAGLVAYLASEEGRDITGTAITIVGGLNA